MEIINSKEILTLSNLKTVFFDTETTSLNPGQICQLAFIVEDQNRKVEVAKCYFFKVDGVDPGAERVHKMSKEFLERESGGKTFADVYTEFYPYFRDNTLVAHNIKFDEKFMSSELWRVGISFRPVDRQCTMEYFKGILQIPNKNPRFGKYKNPNLGELISSFNINQDKVLEYSIELFGGEDITFHDARFDTTAMYVATNIHRESQTNQTKWRDRFCS